MVVVDVTAPGRTVMAVLAIVVVMPICELLLLLCVTAAERIIIIMGKCQWKRASERERQREKHLTF